MLSAVLARYVLAAIAAGAVAAASCAGGARPDVTREHVVTHPLDCRWLDEEFRQSLSTHPQGFEAARFAKVRCSERFGYAVTRQPRLEVLYVRGVGERWVATDVRVDVTQPALRAGVPEDTLRRFREP